jgi:hypothetical protein
MDWGIYTTHTPFNIVEYSLWDPTIRIKIWRMSSSVVNYITCHCLSNFGVLWYNFRTASKTTNFESLYWTPTWPHFSGGLWQCGVLTGESKYQDETAIVYSPNCPQISKYSHILGQSIVKVKTYRAHPPENAIYGSRVLLLLERLVR